MNAELVRAAIEVVHNQQILVNMVSRRVRQLTLGHRPLVEFVPGMGHADVALSEIANGKLTFESRSEEHTSELQSQSNLVCRLLLEKKKNCRRCATYSHWVTRASADHPS